MTPPATGALTIDGLAKTYATRTGGVVALERCDLAIAPGELVAVVGPSGCGKSTLANILAGFDRPTGGRIRLDGREVAGPGVEPRPGPDRVVVFQHGALFPWMTVLENVMYGALRLPGADPARVAGAARDLLARSGGLDEAAERYPGRISSGMQRRVEIVRALMTDPAVLILDEPFRAMDSVTKSRMHAHVLRLHEEVPKTTLFITHDLQEALLLADRVVVMTTRPGRIKQVVDVDLPRPRHTDALGTEAFRALKAATHAAVHEEAEKAFAQGERELA